MNSKKRQEKFKRQRKLKARLARNKHIRMSGVPSVVRKQPVKATTEEALTVADVIIEAMPFADALIAWCIKYPDFKEGLKFSNPDGFLAMGAVLTSGTANAPGDEVIGFLVYDMNEKYFKQDYIVNVGGDYTKFMLYSKIPSKKYGQYVQHIKQFFAQYGKNGDYANTHHLSLADIDAMNNPDLSERARSTIALAGRIDQHGRNRPTQAELAETLVKIRESRAKNELTI